MISKVSQLHPSGICVSRVPWPPCIITVADPVTGRLGVMGSGVGGLASWRGGRLQMSGALWFMVAPRLGVEEAQDHG